MSEIKDKYSIRQNIIGKITEDIIEAYLSDNRTWVVGYSGGKDSTTLLQMIYYAIEKIPPEKRKKLIYVLASDTRVELPHISERLIKELSAIKMAAERDGLPITTHMVYPKLNDTFWVNLIGRGYPSPNTRFRWCTDRLKIHPASEFIREVVNKSGAVIIVLGNRKDESAARAQTLKNSEIQGNRFRIHKDLPKAYVYTPIEDLTANEVWTYLLNVPSPWNGDNKGLVSLYKQASGGECPLVIDNSTASCGHSRFGCWTCTVVDKDKSVEYLIFSGEEKLIPLLEIRDYLRDIRNQPGTRYNQRRNGTIPMRRGTNETMNNTGPFTHQTRMDILKLVLEAQKESGLSLIEADELTIIQEIWNKEETDCQNKSIIPIDAVSKIWKQVFEDHLMSENTSQNDILNKEDQILYEVCEKHNVSFEMMRQLRDIEEEFGHLKRRHGLPERMREIIKQFTPK